MKMQTIASNAKRILSAAFVAVLLLSTSLITRANEPGDDAGDKTAQVIYIGSQDGQRLFNVVYTNNSGSRFTLKVQDHEGNLIFQGSYSDKKFDKKFKLANTDADKLVFVIKNSKDNSTQTFEVNASTRVVEDVEVKEVK